MSYTLSNDLFYLKPGLHITAILQRVLPLETPNVTLDSRYSDFMSWGIDFKNTDILSFLYESKELTLANGWVLKSNRYTSGGELRVSLQILNNSVAAHAYFDGLAPETLAPYNEIYTGAGIWMGNVNQNFTIIFLVMRQASDTVYLSFNSNIGFTPQDYVAGFTYLNAERINVVDPYGTDDNQTEPGGYGPYDYTSETETPPQLPSLSAAQVGFVSLWNPTQSEMQGLANYLWTGTFDLTNFKKLFTDPMECVLSVGIIPITPTREASKREIVFGGSSHSGVNAYAVTEQFYIVDMGTLHITGMSQGALDYSPYAKASIYLPYCGTYALDVDEIMDSDISLEYHIDIYTGACVAYLTIDGHLNSDGKNVNAIMYQFTGNVLASIPITGNDHSQFIQSMLFMGAAAAATVATSGAGAGAAAGAGADLGAETAATGFNKALAGSAINTVMSMKPNVLHSGNLSTTAGMLGGQKPFITMTWSNLCRPEDEYKLVGMPLHKSGTLSDFKGFTIVSACHLDNILCTDAELQLIEQALAKGVIL